MLWIGQQLAWILVRWSIYGRDIIFDLDKPSADYFISPAGMFKLKHLLEPRKGVNTHL
jgi:hypothetical protein